MAKWSVALFGHDKPRFYLQDKVTGKTEERHVIDPDIVGYDTDKYKKHVVTGWEKRAVPGDIIAFKPYKAGKLWSDLEEAHFLIVDIDGPTESQMVALCELYYDTINPDINTHLRKRRFNIPIADLISAGVNEIDMKNKGKRYIPSVAFTKTDCFDKLRDRKVRNSDKLNLMGIS